MNYFENRRRKKYAKELLRHASHCRKMRGDMAQKAQLDSLAAAERDVAVAIADGCSSDVEAKLSRLDASICAIMPPRRLSLVRELVEILVVAGGVAMACRSYFIQPFKIPTGSMQPTLYGIHYVKADRGPWDGVPLRYVKWFVSGKTYVELRARTSGIVEISSSRDILSLESPWDSNGVLRCDARVSVNGEGDLANAGLGLRVRPGEYVTAGHILASGTKVAGDHLFVDRVTWNFRPVMRSEVLVFLTRGIDGIMQNTHYIKRTVGLPGESISVQGSYVAINSNRVETGMVGRIATNILGNGGYQPAGQAWVSSTDHRQRLSKLSGSTGSFQLGPDQYFAMGDNTQSSLDSRYWGSVGRMNLVGRALFVYWPLTRLRIVGR